MGPTLTFLPPTIPNPPRLASRGTSEAGRFEVLAVTDAAGTLDEFIRLDTQTGDLSHMEVGRATTWRMIPFFPRPSPLPDVGPSRSFHLDLADSRAGANPPLLLLSPRFLNKRILLLADLRTGDLFTDWMSPRGFVQ